MEIIVENTSALKSPDLLTAEEIEKLLPELDNLVTWAKQVQEYALEQALKGVKYQGFKVVEGRSNRAFVDTEKVIDRLVGEGYEEDLFYERKFKTLTQVETILGKKKFEPLLGDLVEKPQGKPALVAATDKRKEFTPTESAAADFEE